jgi:hypothetical protein
MRLHPKRPMFRAAYAALAVGLLVAVGLLLAGCGGGASKTNAAPSRPSPPAATTAKLAAVTPPRLSIIAPRRGAHTGPTLTVRVRIAGTAARGSGAFRYLLDNKVSRRGSGELTFHELAPGRHLLQVALASDAGVRVRTSFVVRAPTPVTVTEPAHVTTMAAPTPTPAPQGTAAEPPPPKPPSTPASTPTPPPQPSSGIPQGNGGDGDSDNNGGPSDGDGNV